MTVNTKGQETSGGICPRTISGFQQLDSQKSYWLSVNIAIVGLEYANYLLDRRERKHKACTMWHLKHKMYQLVGFLFS